MLYADAFGAPQDRDLTHWHFGLALAERGRLADALAHFQEASRLNPNNADARMAVNQISRKLGTEGGKPVLQTVSVKKYPSGAVRELCQVKTDAMGRSVPDGFWTEWYEGGEPKRFREYVDGQPQGAEVAWNPNGRLLE